MSLSLINDHPLIWAHRGGRSLAAENTLAALYKAHEFGADGWEIDVQFTKDGELILLHDLNLLRSTNACVHPLFSSNPPALPWRFTLDEIRQLSADIFPRRLCPPKYKERPWEELPESVSSAFRIPTLAEALKLSKELEMYVNIEIKDISKVQNGALGDSIVGKVLDIVKSEQMDEQVLISSFNHNYVIKSKEEAPHILTGALTPHKYEGDAVQLVERISADAWHPGYINLTEDSIIAARNAGIAVNPYTVNDKKVMNSLLKWGVTGIVTDYPQKMLKS